MDSGVHPNLQSKCRDRINYSKPNLEIEYPPPYPRKICDYNRSGTELINSSIESFDWSNLFSGKNAICNFIPNKIMMIETLFG